MSVATAAEAAPAPAAWRWPAGRLVGRWTIAAIVFLGGFVMDEPAPYELLLCTAFVVWAFFGLKLNRHFAPLIVLLLLYLAGGVLALTQLPDPATGVIYYVTSAFMIVSAIFFAAVVAEAPAERLHTIKNAYIAGAVVCALLGIGGYFHLIPGGDIFLRYERVKGAFKDPNVFSPFLVLPIVFICRDLLTDRVSRSLVKIGALLILLLAVFLAFSRAAWGMTVVALCLVSFFTFLTETRQKSRFRILCIFAVGAAVVAVLVVVALSIPEVSDLFKQRAQLVEDYDSGQFGRFARHILGAQLMTQRPLGIGPLVFAHLFGEDEHNMWLKGFTTYGWLGGFSYIILVVWTMIAAGRLIFKPRPWQKYLHCVFAVYLGQVMIHNVIDNDHWRHLFLIYGALWGMIAADKIFLRRARRDAVAVSVSQHSPAWTVSAPVLIPRARVP